MQKKILHDSFREMLPSEVFQRSKKGFEVPLKEWFDGHLKSRFESIAADISFIENQGLFNPRAIEELRSKLYSNNPGDAPATAWALLVFQNWYSRYMI